MASRVEETWSTSQRRRDLAHMHFMRPHATYMRCSTLSFFRRLDREMQKEKQREVIQRSENQCICNPSMHQS